VRIHLSLTNSDSRAARGSDGDQGSVIAPEARPALQQAAKLLRVNKDVLATALCTRSIEVGPQNQKPRLRSRGYHSGHMLDPLWVRQEESSILDCGDSVWP
jgi:hypothetical protein